jgi:5-(carboxyamino)imidazole ribonucleotide mutase
VGQPAWVEVLGPETPGTARQARQNVGITVLGRVLTTRRRESDEDGSPMKTVGVVMGSASDATVMEGAVEALREFGVPVEVRVLSAHRTPDDALQFARDAEGRGFGVLIAGAGKAAHLAGVLAAVTSLPVIGVPIASGGFGGLDALLAMVQMPGGVPVATVAVDGARNAGLLAVRMLALSDGGLAAALEKSRHTMAEKVRAADEEIRARYAEGGS